MTSPDITELRSGRLIREKCGRPLVQGKLNMDAWLVNIKCGGDCHKAGAHYQTPCFVFCFSLYNDEIFTLYNEADDLSPARLRSPSPSGRARLTCWWWPPSLTWTSPATASAATPTGRAVSAPRAAPTGPLRCRVETSGQMRGSRECLMFHL